MYFSQCYIVGRSNIVLGTHAGIITTISCGSRPNDTYSLAFTLLFLELSNMATFGQSHYQEYQSQFAKRESYGPSKRERRYYPKYHGNT